MFDTHGGYRYYSPVLSRLAGDDFRRAGGGLNFPCPLGHHRPGHRNQNAYVKIGQRGELVARCLGCGAGWAEFVSYVGLPASSWWPQAPDARPQKGGRGVSSSKPVAEYPYHDHRGELVAVKVRWEPGFDGRRKKDFTWRRPLPAADRERLKVPKDAFAWVKGLEAGLYAGQAGRDGSYWFSPVSDRTRPNVVEMPRLEVGPYREHEVLAAATGRTVLVVEGEGKADLLWQAGVVATSGPAGKGVWRAEWGDMFRWRRVVAVPDPDGVEWACKVLASGVGHAADSLCLAVLPPAAVRANHDIKDWLLAQRLDAAGVRRALAGLIRSGTKFSRG